MCKTMNYYLGDKNMRIIDINERTHLLIKQLLYVWEDSVRAAHTFLSNTEIENIKKYIPKLLKNIPILIIAEKDNKIPVGFNGYI